MSTFFIFGAGYSGKAFAKARDAMASLVEAPPPLTPPLKGEGELPPARPSSMHEEAAQPQATSPSPLRGGARGGGTFFEPTSPIPEDSSKSETIFGTTRSADNFGSLREAGITPLTFDGALTPEIDAALRHTTHLIVSIAPDEAGDPVLNAARDAIAAMPALQWIGYLSTVGVYGDHGGAWVDETAECRPVSKRSRLRVAAEQEWLKFGDRTGIPMAVLRLSGIYGPGRNAFVNLANGTAKRLTKPGQVFNRIHAEDIAGALWHLAGRNQGGVFNVTDDLPAPPQDVVEYAAFVMNVPPPPEISFETAQLSPMARSFYGENKRVSNAAIKADGYRFRFPDYRSALDHLWQSGNWEQGEPRSPMKRR